MADLYDFENINLRRLHMITKDENLCIFWLKDHGLLCKQRQCSGCKGNMKMKKYFWCCGKKSCGAKKSIRNGTFFEKCRLSFGSILELTYYWSQKVDSVREIRHEFGIAGVTLTNYLDIIRDICAEHFRKGYKIGGPGKEVEVAEAVLVEWRTRGGKETKELRVLGGVEVSTGRCFIIRIENASNQIMCAHLQKFVESGSIVTSSIFDDYPSINDMGYIYKSLNSEPGASSRHIKLLFQNLKQIQKERQGFTRQNIQLHFYEFMWRRIFRDSPFKAFWEQVKELYPL